MRKARERSRTLHLFISGAMTGMASVTTYMGLTRGFTPEMLLFGMVIPVAGLIVIHRRFLARVIVVALLFRAFKQ